MAVFDQTQDLISFKGKQIKWILISLCIGLIAIIVSQQIINIEGKEKFNKEKDRLKNKIHENHDQLENLKIKNKELEMKYKEQIEHLKFIKIRNDELEMRHYDQIKNLKIVISDLENCKIEVTSTKKAFDKYIAKPLDNIKSGLGDIFDSASDVLKGIKNPFAH